MLKKTHVDIFIWIEMTRERNLGIKKNHPVYADKHCISLLQLLNVVHNELIQTLFRTLMNVTFWLLWVHLSQSSLLLPWSTGNHKGMANYRMFFMGVIVVADIAKYFSI